MKCRLYSTRGFLKIFNVCAQASAVDGCVNHRRIRDHSLWFVWYRNFQVYYRKSLRIQISSWK